MVLLFAETRPPVPNLFRFRVYSPRMLCLPSAFSYPFCPLFLRATWFMEARLKPVTSRCAIGCGLHLLFSACFSHRITGCSHGLPFSFFPSPVCFSLSGAVRELVCLFSPRS